MRLWHYQQPGEHDVFWGQVLALHPISSLLMKRPHHLVALGRYLASTPARDCGSDAEKAGNPMYWAFVETVLIACHEYKHVRAQGELDRGKRACGDSLVQQATRDDAPVLPARAFEQYAEERKLVCDRCQGPLKLDAYEIVPGAEPGVRVTCHCARCGTRRVVTIAPTELGRDNEPPP